MKKHSLWLLVFLSCQASAQQQFTLNGTVKGLQSGLLYLYYEGTDGNRLKDSATLQNGQFKFSGNINGPAMAYIGLKEDTRNEANSTNIVLEPAPMEIGLEYQQFSKAVLTGSATQLQQNELQAAKQKIQAKYQVLLDSLGTEKDKEKNAAIRERLAPYFQETKEVDIRFFDANPQSYLTAYMLIYHVSSLKLDQLQKYYNGLGSRLQASTSGKRLAEEIADLRSGSPGSMAKDFTAKDINGQQLSLSDFKGKYVLLDFWASWCVPCRKGNPHLIQLYRQYKDKGIEFIGISDDDRNHDAWKKAVEKDGIGMWRHVLRGLRYDAEKGYDKTFSVSERFGIHSLPTKILIDPQGKIIGRFGEEEEELDKQLAQIFK